MYDREGAVCMSQVIYTNTVDLLSNLLNTNRPKQ